MQRITYHSGISLLTPLVEFGYLRKHQNESFFFFPFLLLLLLCYSLSQHIYIHGIFHILVYTTILENLWLSEYFILSNPYVVKVLERDAREFLKSVTCGIGLIAMIINGICIYSLVARGSWDDFFSTIFTIIHIESLSWYKERWNYYTYYHSFRQFNVLNAR